MTNLVASSGNLYDLIGWPNKTKQLLNLEEAYRICEVCHTNKADGDVYDASKNKNFWCCQDCYYNKLKMRPIGYVD